MKSEEQTAIFIHNMRSGESYIEHEQDIFIAQDVIKLPILLAVLNQLSFEKRMKTSLTLKESDKVPGNGALKELSCGMEFSLDVLCNCMISLNDNVAANMIIDFFGIPWFQSIFPKMGLCDTRLNRKIFDFEKQAQGIENTFSCTEICFLLERIFVSTYSKRGDAYAQATDYLIKHQFNCKVSPELHSIAKVAHISESSSRTTHDVGVVFSSIPYTYVFVAENTNTEEMEQYFRFLSKGMAKGRF